MKDLKKLRSRQMEKVIQYLLEVFLKMKMTEDQTKFPVPVILTCPHGGIAWLNPKRVDSNLPPGSRDNFSDDSDLLTIHLTESIAANI